MPNYDEKAKIVKETFRNEDAQMAKELFQTGNAAWKSGKYEEAKISYNRAARIFLKVEDLESMAMVSTRLGDMELSLGNYKEARVSLVFAISYIENIDYAKGVYIEALIRLAKVYFAQGDDKQALKYLSQAQKVANESGNAELAGEAFDVEAEIYLTAGKEDDALKAYQKAVNRYEQQRSEMKQAATLRAMARIEMSRKNYDTAHDILEKSRVLYRELGDFLGEASVLSAIGSLRYIIKDIENARKALMKAVHLYGKVSHHFAEAEALLYLARVESFDRASGDFDRAKSHYKKSAELFGFLGNDIMVKAVTSEYEEFLKKM